MVADPGADFVAGATTSLTLEVHDGSGLMSGDNTTRITLAPTGSGTVSVVGTGTLIAGTLGVPGGAVTVEVSTRSGWVRMPGYTSLSKLSRLAASASFE